jgi:hypothetical protein
MGAIGRKRAKLFTVGTVANRIEQIYMELLNENHVAPNTDNNDRGHTNRIDSDVAGIMLEASR